MKSTGDRVELKAIPEVKMKNKVSHNWWYRPHGSLDNGVEISHHALLRMLDAGRLDLDADEVRPSDNARWISARDAVAILEIHRLHTRPPVSTHVITGLLASVLGAVACALAIILGTDYHPGLSRDEQVELVNGVLESSELRASLVAGPIKLSDSDLNAIASRIMDDDEVSNRLVQATLRSPLRLSEADLDSIARGLSNNEGIRASLIEQYSGGRIRVSGLEVVDDMGRVRVVLGTDNQGSVGQTIIDEKGVERIRVCVENGGVARWRLYSHDAKPAVSAATWASATDGEYRGGLTLYESRFGVAASDENPELKVSIDDSGMRLFDKDTVLRASVLSDNSNGWAGLWLSGGKKVDGKEGIRVAVHADGQGLQDLLGGAKARYFDGGGAMRAVIHGGNEKNVAGMWLMDESQGDQVVLYSQARGPGGQLLKNGSSIDLYDGNGSQRVMLDGDNDGHGYAGLWLIDSSSRTRAMLLSGRDGASSLNLFDAYGRDRAGLAVLSSNTANAYIQDTLGKSVWFAESDAGGGFRNYRKMTQEEEAWEVAGKLSTIGDGVNLLNKLFSESDK